mgnify:CR=1 FL=1
MDGKKRKVAHASSAKAASSSVFAEWNTFDVSIQLGDEFAAVLPQHGDAVGEDRSSLLSNDDIDDIETEFNGARTRNVDAVSDPSGPSGPPGPPGPSGS